MGSSAAGLDDVLDGLWAEARALSRARRFEDAAGVWGRLIDLADEAGSADRTATISRAMEFRCRCLREAGSGEALLEAVDVLQACCAESEQAQARAAAAGGLFDAAWWLLCDGQSDAAILISDQLIARLADADDPVVLGRIAEVLCAVATQLSWAGSFAREPLTLLALLVAGLIDAARGEAPSVGVQLRDPNHVWEAFARRRRVAGWCARRLRLLQAVRVYELLIERFGAADDPALRKVATGAAINRAVSLVVLGRFAQARAAFSDLFSEHDLGVVEIVTSARPHEDGSYNPTDRIAAILALAQPTHSQPGDAQIRGAARKILRRK